MLSGSLPYYFARYDNSLDLRGSLIEAEQTYIAIEVLDRIVLHISGAAVYLHGIVCNPSNHFGTKQLAACSFANDIDVAFIKGPCGIKNHATPRIGFCAHIGQHRLNHLMFGDTFAKLYAAAGKADRFLNRTLRRTGADGRYMKTPAIEYFHSGLETASFDPANYACSRNAYILKIDIAGLGASLAHFVVGCSDRETGQIPFHQKGADSRWARTTRTSHERENSGNRRIGNEALRAVDDIAVSVAFGSGAYCTGIRTDIRLCQCE
ncbi:hypothetical protein DK59_3070 [Brucella abortus bv. 4 str. 292]|nr:hypothetical protein DK59_3070 [Brucella abortus bv. 4 str. 292]